MKSFSISFRVNTSMAFVLDAERIEPRRLAADVRGARGVPIR